MRPPRRQGDADNLCGFYATLNAIEWIVRPLDDQTELSLVTSSMAKAIEKADTLTRSPFVRAFVSGVRCGLRVPELQAAIVAASEVLATPMSGRVPPRKTWTSVDLLWSEFETHAEQPQSAIILGFYDREKELDHWICVTSVSRTKMVCRDSLSGKPETLSISRSRCGVGARSESQITLSPAWTLLIRAGETAQ